jgi:hypothetical protein
MKFHGPATLLVVSILFGATSIANAGAYGDEPEPEEGPAPVAMAPAPPPAPEPEPQIMREFAGFLTDAETTRGFWAEIGTVYSGETDGRADYDLWTLFARLAAGGEMWEVGAQLPYSWLDDDLGFEDDGLEDLQLWGKVLPIRTDIVTAGAGMVVTAPSGDEPTFSSDEWGLNPFLTAAFAAGPASIRTMVGYERFIDIDNSDALTYNVAALVPVADQVVVRGEFAGEHVFDADFDPVSFVPGVDVVIPLGEVDLWLRFVGAVGLTDEAADWSLGGSLAITKS